MSRILSPTFIILLLSLVISFWAGKNITPTWKVEKTLLDVKSDSDSKYYYTYKGKPKYIEPIESHSSKLSTSSNYEELYANEQGEEFVFEKRDDKKTYYVLTLKKHYRFWSLLPALVAVILCWITREPITSLFGGIVSGAFLLGLYDLTEKVFVPTFMTKGAAGVLLLYLWLLGGLMGIWSKTGAATAFASYMTKHFVSGPRSAKLVAWFLGVIFFQGGTVSTVLVGTTVKPIADKENISHEELAYIVDSTASPIASQLAFNAWPGYIQAFIFVVGVPWLATETLRISFFFKSVPFCFYAIFAVLGTFLMSIDKPIFLGKRMRAAIKRSRETGELDAPGANPLSAKELESTDVPKNYTPHLIDFLLPLGTLITIAIGTFIAFGSPEVRWAFGAAMLVASFLALGKGMALTDLIDGIGDGLKGVVMGSVILLLAMTIGGISKEAGGGLYLVELLGNTLPYWSLPVVLQILTIIIAFSTGTSWGTYAVAFPLAMPLSYALATHHGLAHPELFMTLCFAAVMDGSVFGDQCSPISDTTVLSSMCCGCDLMDHVKTQMPSATFAAVLAGICWTACAYFLV